jgi:hypothetical protein
LSRPCKNVTVCAGAAAQGNRIKTPLGLFG